MEVTPWGGRPHPHETPRSRFPNTDKGLTTPHMDGQWISTREDVLSAIFCVIHIFLFSVPRCLSGE